MDAALSKRAPRGIRNHNPGNLRLPHNDERPGYAGSDKDGFSKFTTAQYGLESLARLLVNYGMGGLNTIAKIVNRYAPSKENNTMAYAGFLAGELETDTDAPIDMKCAENIADLMEGIIYFENGRQPYRRSAILSAAEKAVNPGGKK